jgi:hypothetical protein
VGGADIVGNNNDLGHLILSIKCLVKTRHFLGGGLGAPWGYADGCTCLYTNLLSMYAAL